MPTGSISKRCGRGGYSYLSPLPPSKLDLSNALELNQRRFDTLSFACSARSWKCRLCKRLPYHHGGATETRRRKRLQSSTLWEQHCRCASAKPRNMRRNSHSAEDKNINMSGT